MGGHFVEIVHMLGTVKDPAKDLGMQGLDSSPQNGWVPGEVFNLLGFDTQALQKIPGAPGGPNFDASLVQCQSQSVQAFFVVNRDKCGAYRANIRHGWGSSDEG